MIPFLAFLIVSFVLFITGSLIIYNIIYNHRIKKQFASGVTGARPWPAPSRILIVVLIAGMVIALGVTVVSIIAAEHYVVNTSCDGSTLVDNNTPESWFLTSEEIGNSSMSVYADAFTTGKLPGYTKTECKQDDFRYVLFMNDERHSSLQPDFVMFVEYVGEEKFTRMVEINYMDSYQGGGGSSSTFTDVSEYYFIAGDGAICTTDCTQTIGLYKNAAVAEKDFGEGNVTNADASIEITVDLSDFR